MLVPSSVVFYNQMYQLIQSVEPNKITLIDFLGNTTEVPTSEILEVIAKAPNKSDDYVRYLSIIFDEYKPSSTWGGFRKKKINLKELLHDLQVSFGMTAYSSSYLFSNQYEFTANLSERHLHFYLTNNAPETIVAIKNFLSTAFRGQSLGISYGDKKRIITLFNDIPNVNTLIL